MSVCSQQHSNCPHKCAADINQVNPESVMLITPPHLDAIRLHYRKLIYFYFFIKPFLLMAYIWINDFQDVAYFIAKQAVW